MAKKTVKALTEEYQGMQQQYQEAAAGLSEKETELNEKLLELRAQLETRQQRNALDISAESLAKDTDLRQEIARTEMTLTSVTERQNKVAFKPGMTEMAKEIFDRTKEEAVTQHDKKLPALLAEIEDAKFAYLAKLEEFHELQSSTRGKVIDAGNNVGHHFGNLDIPNLKGVAWFHRDHHDAEGVRYCVDRTDIQKALAGHSYMKPTNRA